ncbi:hypothetical protein AVEN_150063-1 [Araneus ventricosus]|uniref:Uncharacterized protein n=1 Tax=Araneus ventricosus TaxID=182803 RepID=A0A4Y2ES53_ARAVE|nr:hypothetical protein AVEN_150063-1 [Araneus ventricosus]
MHLGKSITSPLHPEAYPKLEITPSSRQVSASSLPPLSRQPLETIPWGYRGFLQLKLGKGGVLGGYWQKIDAPQYGFLTVTWGMSLSSIGCLGSLHASECGSVDRAVPGVNAISVSPSSSHVCVCVMR